ncbi:MAG: hypothetical protein ABI871_00245 [Chthoniobacterales bacterium]
MNNVPSSRRGARLLACGFLLALYVFPLYASDARAITLTRAEVIQIGRKVWQNECNGTIEGLTSWNAGENFASLGIGHFIWYPKNLHGPFEESFPKLVAFVSARGAKLPPLLPARRENSCPWDSREEFMRAGSSAEMIELRHFLAETIDLQAEFLVQRLRDSVPKLLAEAGPGGRSSVQQRFDQLAVSAAGAYALVDYVNFKGEGVVASERYHGQGWGLLQVLEGMRDTESDSAVREFARSARTVLTARVANSPSERHEARWLPGWLNRVATYTKN